jgi:hypothetical protein
MTYRKYLPLFPLAGTMCAVLLGVSALSGGQVNVRFKEGVVHGFLALRDLQGKLLADGETTQHAEGDRVTGRVIFRFKDGSLYDETTVFSQRGTFRLLTEHLVEKGPAFKNPMEVWLDGATGEIKVRYTEDNGDEKTVRQRLDLPADVANGLLTTLIKDIPPDAAETTVSMVAGGAKPRIVKLVIRPEGREPVVRGAIKNPTLHYVVKVKIGGVSGVIAPLVGKQPPDTHVWVLGGSAPAFVKLEGPLYEGGPIWRIETASPTQFPKGEPK